MLIPRPIPVTLNLEVWYVNTTEEGPAERVRRRSWTGRVHLGSEADARSRGFRNMHEAARWGHVDERPERHRERVAKADFDMVAAAPRLNSTSLAL